MTDRTISEVASEVGVTSDTLRYYEKVGLVSPSGRTTGGYRVYGDEVVDRLRLIKGAQLSGLHLNEIGALLEIRDHGACPCGHAEGVVARRIAEVDDDLRRLHALRKDLVELLRSARTGRDPKVWAGEAELMRKRGDLAPMRKRDDDEQVRPCPVCGCECGVRPCCCCGN